MTDEKPDARVLALDIGLYGHVGSMSAFYWWRTGGSLHTHTHFLFEVDDSLLDQLELLEAWAEEYPEYRFLAPVVIVGTTVLSPVGRQTVRDRLDRWLSPPSRRRLINIGDYAGEQAATRGIVPRKKMRDLVSLYLAQRRLTVTDEQYAALQLYTGKREKPGRDPDEDGWRVDETDAIALPVAEACFAAKYLLPPPIEGSTQLDERMARYARAWQLELDLDDAQAQDHAWRYGHPHQQRRPEREWALRDDTESLTREPAARPTRPVRGGHH